MMSPSNPQLGFRVWGIGYEGSGFIFGFMGSLQGSKG